MTIFQEGSILPVILALPYAGRQYTFDSDELDLQVGCMLMQGQLSQNRKQTGFWSRSLTEAEKTYDIAQRECMVFVWSTLSLRSCHEESIPTLRMDHDSLFYVLNRTDASGMITRLWLHLLKFEFNILHRTGVSHKAAHSLSRLPIDNMSKMPLQNDILVMVINANKDARTQLLDLCTERHHQYFDARQVGTSKSRPHL